MLIGFVDTVRSTDAVEAEGMDALLRLRTQLAYVADSLRAVGTELPDASPHRYIGERQGDGFIFGAPRELALAYVRAVAQMQCTTWMHEHWVPLTFALGLAMPNWSGEPWAPGSLPNGRDITIIARLREYCPPNGVVVTQDLWRLVWERAPQLRTLFRASKRQLQGFKEMESFWVLRERIRGREVREKMMIALLGGMLLLLAAHAGGTWQSAHQFKMIEDISTKQTINLVNLEGSIQALIWTLCETTPTCKDRNVDEPAYMKYLRDRHRQKPGAPPSVIP